MDLSWLKKDQAGLVSVVVQDRLTRNITEWRQGYHDFAIGGAAGLVVLAELVQFLLPARNPTWADVAWGLAGAIAGVVVAFCVLDIYRVILNRRGVQFP